MIPLYLGRRVAMTEHTPCGIVLVICLSFMKYVIARRIKTTSLSEFIAKWLTHCLCIIMLRNGRWYQGNVDT